MVMIGHLACAGSSSSTPGGASGRSQRCCRPPPPDARPRVAELPVAVSDRVADLARGRARRLPRARPRGPPRRRGRLRAAVAWRSPPPGSASRSRPGSLVEVLWRRRPVWVVAVPLAVYALWWLVYQDTRLLPPQRRRRAAVRRRRGRGRPGGRDGPHRGTLRRQRHAHRRRRRTRVGTPARPRGGRRAPVWRLAALRPVPVRVFALLAVAVAFWLLEGCSARSSRARTRAATSTSARCSSSCSPSSSCAACAPARPWPRSLVALTGLAVVSNLGDLRAGARCLRARRTSRARTSGHSRSRATRSSRATTRRASQASRSYRSTRQQYFAAAQALGSPAYDPAELAGGLRAGPPDRRRRDREHPGHRAAPSAERAGRRIPRRSTRPRAAGSASRAAACTSGPTP